jgi:thymidylate synthase (FAD)
MEYTSTLTCELIDSAASDLAVVNAARISVNVEHPDMEKGDAELIKYLMKNKHGSPFEHGFFKFRVEAPIFVFREWHRHRVGHSYNEMSGRYTELEPKFYIPETARTQHGKPGHYTFEEAEPESTATRAAQAAMKRSYQKSWDEYQNLLGQGVAKEQARLVLPVSIFSKMIWSCNPRSLMHFLNLRTAEQAMAEIRKLAYAAEFALLQTMPTTYAAWVDNKTVAP